MAGFVLVTLHFRKKQTDARIRALASERQAILDAIPGYVSWVGRDLTYRGANQALAEAFGLSPTDFEGKPIGFRGGVHKGKLESIMAEFFSGDKQFLQTEIIFDFPSGPSPFLLSAKKYHHNQKAVLIAIDLTEQKATEQQKVQMQTQLFQAAKLASIGTLASGIAHEINNPLAIIKGHISLLRKRFTEENSLTEFVDKSLQVQDTAIDRIARIVNSLRTYARQDTEGIEAVDIHKVITETLALIEPIFKKLDIRMDFVQNSPQHMVKGNSGKLRQIITNLLTNSHDALEQKKEDRRIQIATDTENGFLVLKLSDNGCGIEEKHMSRLFDPFFTTKAPGKGTGIGLSSCHSMVESFGGSIQAQSTVGVGTTFIIRLPLA
jgi:C4-dicarboxylate-specific signal transduction histidine kinase